jgi:dipeptidase
VVCQSRSWLPAEIGAVCWRAMATPCTSAFTPWYFGSREVPAAYRTGTNQHTGNYAYWTFRNLSRFADVRYETVIGRTHKELEAFEKQEFAAPRPRWKTTPSRSTTGTKRAQKSSLADTRATGPSRQCAWGIPCRDDRVTERKTLSIQGQE